MQQANPVATNQEAPGQVNTSHCNPSTTTIDHNATNQLLRWSRRCRGNMSRVPHFLELLHLGGDPNGQDNHGNHLIDLVIMSNQLELVALLLDHKAMPCIAARDGISTLHLAVAQGNLAIVHCLLEHPVMAHHQHLLNAADHNGCTPLHRAVMMANRTLNRNRRHELIQLMSPWR
jgi:ankyrin repeat protein